MPVKTESPADRRNRDLTLTMHELELTNEKLAAATAFQKAVLDNAGAMIIVTDEKGIIKLFNPEASLNIGYRPEELIDKETPVIFHDRGEIIRKKTLLRERYGYSAGTDFDVFVEKARRNIHQEEQYTYIRKDGTSLPVLLSITAIRDRKGMITGFMGVSIDISERKKAEEDLRASLKKEKELSELKSRFVTMASHEFKSPLSTILSSAYLIEKYVSADEQPKREKHLQRIVSSVNMLTDILNDFLSVGQIEEGRIQTRFSYCRIPELFQATINEFIDNLKPGQRISYRHRGEEEFCLDPTLMKHIILNLLSNASKFSGEGRKITISTSVKNDELKFRITDQGIGISRADQEHLMERFFRGANAGNIQGTGLGLNIVAKYAELMNGRVQCDSDLDSGTSFTVTLNQ